MLAGRRGGRRFLVSGKLRDYSRTDQANDRSTIASFTRSAMKRSLADKCHYSVEMK